MFPDASILELRALPCVERMNRDSGWKRSCPKRSEGAKWKWSPYSTLDLVSLDETQVERADAAYRES